MDSSSLANTSGPSALGTVGSLLLVGGLIGLVYALGMDTSASSSFGQRVNNIGLMNDKQNYIIAAGVTALLGALCFLGGRRSS